jgi:hypothetical protein
MIGCCDSRKDLDCCDKGRKNNYSRGPEDSWTARSQSNRCGLGITFREDDNGELHVSFMHLLQMLEEALKMS